MDGIAGVYDVESLTRSLVLRGHAAAVSDVFYSDRDNLAVTSSHDGTVRLWDLKTGMCISVINPTALSSSSSVSSSATSPKRSLVRADRTQELSTACLSSDGTRLMVLPRFAPPRLLDLRTGRVLAKCISSSVPSSAPASPSSDSFSRLGRRACFLQDSGIVALGGGNGSVALWDAADGRRVANLSLGASPESILGLHRRSPAALVASPQDRGGSGAGWLAVGSDAGVVLWGPGP